MNDVKFAAITGGVCLLLSLVLLGQNMIVAGILFLAAVALNIGAMIRYGERNGNHNKVN